jgi:hypothetical protein
VGTLKPINVSSPKTDISEKLTSAEMGKLWATYMGNSMCICILSYFLQHVEDKDIKTLLENALALSEDFLYRTEEILKKENFYLPKGFSLEEDVSIGAPRLFQDEYYPHYLKYTAKSGLSIYNIAIPLVYRKDIKDFFMYCMNSTLALMDQIKEVLMNKGLIMKPPIIPVPDRPDFVKDHFLNGFFGQIRPLHAMEIAHFYDNIENNVTSKALITAFAQVAKDEKIKKLFEKGRDLTDENIQQYMQMLHNAHLPSPSYLDDLVTASTFSPFSDKLMVFHKMDMFTMKIRSFGNSIAVSGRHDVAYLYSKSFVKIGMFVQDAAKIMIENGWMEHAPYAPE